MSLAIDVILHLIRDLEVDCLALGEVRYADLLAIAESIGCEHYSIFDGTLKKGRLQFDTGVIYNADRLRLAHSSSLVTSRGTTSLKVANRLDLLALDTKEPLHVFVSHWPSRLWCHENGANRHLLGVRLRDAFDDVRKLYFHPPKVVFLGDFNDEPFDPALAEQLLATRDRKLVRSCGEYLYNPFWRHLGEQVPHVPGKPCRSYAGSCFYSAGKETHWRTFDQIIFSSAFLGESDWHLNEDTSKILQLSPYDASVLKDSAIFDHFPVMSVIQKEGVIRSADKSCALLGAC
jgi:hypothetical protein